MGILLTDLSDDRSGGDLAWRVPLKGLDLAELRRLRLQPGDDPMDHVDPKGLRGGPFANGVLDRDTRSRAVLMTSWNATRPIAPDAGKER